jgi:predicted RNase H-like nuclease (RuvC/YqgF family)
MKKGHEDRFFDKLESELPEKEKSNSYFWLKIAASILIMVGIGSYIYVNGAGETNQNTTIVNNEESKDTDSNISLRDLSPDLEKIENYYVANINLELANLEVSDDNKGVVDGYMEQLEALDAEYKRLNKELNEVGPNDQTIEALIQNLQLRLQLLKKLKEKLNQLKLSKNEQTSSI